MQTKRDEREAYIAEAVEEIRLATEELELCRNLWTAKNIFIRFIVKVVDKKKQLMKFTTC